MAPMGVSSARSGLGLSEFWLGLPGMACSGTAHLNFCAMCLRREYAKGSIIKVRAKQFMVRSLFLASLQYFVLFCC